MVASHPSHRLPHTVRPERYELEVVPDLDRATFAGSVAIDVVVTERVGEIRLNAAGLTIESAELTAAGGGARAAEVTEDAETETVTLRLDGAVAAGTATVRLSFSGPLDDGLRGFYRSSFTGADDVKHLIATTQFEATDARRAFPCWDEPEFKAVFSLTLVVPAGLTALSSGPVVADEATGDGRRRIRFADTMRMSTYILAWVVGPFELTEAVDVDGTPLRIAAPAGRAHLTPFGLEAGAQALRYLSSYFALAYPGDKLDHVAIPDFAFGAMENLGCVTYRETALLADLERASQPELLRVARVVAHETAHMWFGNLVTMKWWNGIWLNEAFATFMELKTVEAWRPDWDVWTTHAAARAAALGVDGLMSTRPIEFEVVRPEDAEAMFDVLTYEKGGSVLRMLEQFLGEDTFQRGIARYLAEHRYANTETTDLWDALEAESGQPVRSTMDSWIFREGYPLVSVEAGTDGRSVVLSQERFVYRGTAEGDWAVPIILRASVAGTVVERRILLGGTETVDLGGPVDWVIANGGGWGFYRARYQPALLPPLAELQSICTPLERISLVGDAWAAVAAGAAELGEFLILATGLGEETDPDVWGAVAAPLGLLDRIVADGDRPQLQRLVARIAGPAFAALGWDPADGEAARTSVARGRLLSLLGTVGADESVRAEAAARHRRFVAEGSGLSPDVLTATVTTIAATGGADNYDDLLNLYLAAATPQDQIRYLMALATFADPDLVRRTLELAVSPQVRVQDGPFLVGRVLAGPAGDTVAWPWIEAHIGDLLARFPRNLLVRAFEGLPALSDPETAERAHRFLEANPLPVGGSHVAQLEEQLDITVSLAGRLRATLGEVLGRF